MCAFPSLKGFVEGFCHRIFTELFHISCLTEHSAFEAFKFKYATEKKKILIKNSLKMKSFYSAFERDENSSSAPVSVILHTKLMGPVAIQLFI